MDKEDMKEIDEIVGDTGAAGGPGGGVGGGPLPEELEAEYDFELWLSTDGKHTVKVAAKTHEGKKKALKVATETYDYILTRYGTKQGQAVKEYGKENGAKPPTVTVVNPETCTHVEVKFAQSHTEKNPNRWFKSCKTCKKFLGWND